MKAKVCREITGSAVATASSPSSAPIIPIRKSGNPPREPASGLLWKERAKSLQSLLLADNGEKEY